MSSELGFLVSNFYIRGYWEALDDLLNNTTRVVFGDPKRAELEKMAKTMGFRLPEASSSFSLALDDVETLRKSYLNLPFGKIWPSKVQDYSFLIDSKRVWEENIPISFQGSLGVGDLVQIAYPLFQKDIGALGLMAQSFKEYLTKLESKEGRKISSFRPALDLRAE